MKQLLLTLTFLIAAMSYCNAQEIEIDKVFGGYKFTQDGKQLSMGALVKTMESNQEAFKLMKSAKASNSAASVLGFAGGFLIGWPIGTALGGGEPNWTLAGAGTGLIAIGLPFSSQAKNKSKQAVELYNASLNSTVTNVFNPEFKFTLTGTGVGLSMSF